MPVSYTHLDVYKRQRLHSRNDLHDLLADALLGLHSGGTDVGRRSVKMCIRDSISSMRTVSKFRPRSRPSGLRRDTVRTAPEGSRSSRRRCV